MGKKFNRVCSLLLCLALMAGSAVPAGAAFSDVSAGSWYYDAVSACAEKGCVSGVGGDRFDPDGKLTYAQVFTMLASAFFKEGKQSYENDRAQEMAAYFGGTPEWWGCSAYYFMDNGFLSGTYVNIKSARSVNSPITRYEMVQIVTNILSARGISASDAERASAESGITDWSSIPANYRAAVAACFSKGIVSGYSGGTFSGDQTLTRAQACVILNSLETVLSGGSIPVEKPDIPDTASKEIEVTTITTEWGTGYYVADNGFGDGYLNNGKPITEANVKELLAEAEKIWPTGMSWTYSGTKNNHWYEWSGLVVDSILLSKHNISPNYACGGFAAMVSDYIFGLDSNPMRLVTDHSQIRPGDIIVKLRTNKTPHISLVVDSPRAGTAWTADGNYSSTGIGWPDYQYGAPGSEAVDNSFGVTWFVYTRYPA